MTGANGPERWGPNAPSSSTRICWQKTPIPTRSRNGSAASLRFLEGKDQRSTLEEMLHVGLRPRTHQYGDPQDFGVDQYTVVLRATDDCGR